MGATEETVYFNLSIDCEATQPAVDDPGLGERASRGIAEVLTREGWGGTFFVIPTDIEAHHAMYRELRDQGHEVGLHLHPAVQGYAEFCGIYDAATQQKIISEAADRFAQCMGERPQTFCMGYASANDYTYAVLEAEGFTHGTCSIPGRILPECAAVWAGAPLFMHYAHAYNRVLPGDMDFVEIPNTIDWESRMWGGKHPQDLRIELVDAKNHFYTIEKAVRRQFSEASPVKLIHASTHNIFEYSDFSNFRRQTLEGVIGHYRRLVADNGCLCEGTTLAQAAALYRRKTGKKKVHLELDRRGYR